MKQYYVYIMTNISKTLYTGVTSDLKQRVYQHKCKIADGFTRKYKISKLVYFEMTESINSAITREKQIKGWLRKKKTALIESFNPAWKDLSEDWFDKETIANSCHSERSEESRRTYQIKPIRKADSSSSRFHRDSSE